jgi:hypothetical protein
VGQAQRSDRGCIGPAELGRIIRRGAKLAGLVDHDDEVGALKAVGCAQRDIGPKAVVSAGVDDAGHG